jgi:hypothetical protein
LQFVETTLLFYLSALTQHNFTVRKIHPGSNAAIYSKEQKRDAIYPARIGEMLDGAMSPYLSPTGKQRFLPSLGMKGDGHDFQ